MMELPLLDAENYTGKTEEERKKLLDIIEKAYPFCSDAISILWS